MCCAGIRPSTNEFLRLFPIRYRRLPEEQRFGRFDLVEMQLAKANDGRPESYRVEEDSIQILESAKHKRLSDESKVELWKRFVYPSLADLEAANKENGTSLGIIRPENILQFHHETIAEAEAEDRAMTEMVYQQGSLLEEPLKPLESPEYNFFYRFDSGEQKNIRRTIQDWEVQAAYRNFKRQYGPGKALGKLYEQYAERLPQQNLHFMLGTMAKRKWQFILIGLLRSPIDPNELAQGRLF